MGWMQGKARVRSRRLLALVVGAAIGVTLPSAVVAQVRGKLPDRGVYTPPRLDGAAGGLPQVPAETNVSSAAEDLAVAPNPDDGRRLADYMRDTEFSLPQPVRTADVSVEPRFKPGEEGNWNRPLVEVALDTPAGPQSVPGARTVRADSFRGNVDRSANTAPSTNQFQSRTQPRAVPSSRSGLRQVAHEEVHLVPPRPPAEVTEDGRGRSTGKLAGFPHQVVIEPEMHHDATCDGCDQCGPLACDAVGCGIDCCDSCDAYCDSLGCDSIGGCSLPWYRRWTNGSLSLHRDRWFGGIEYLMMWQRGDRLPPLLTNEQTEGDNPTVDLLVGNERIMERMASGGRVTIGTWLDTGHCLSLVGRGWYGGKKTYDYHREQGEDQTTILARPFLNVSDDQDPTPDTRIIAAPDRATGSIQIGANSEVFGADVSLRQYLWGDLGLTLDFLYGYQFMRLNEWLGIDTNSTSLDDDFAPVGSMISVSDHFQTSNEFHGGQLGFATNYREGCWSFNGLLKVGFGPLARRATRTGLTVTQVDDATAMDPQGLLVRSTNDGTVSDHTFGWVPELDVSLGWHRYAGWDLTFGYQLIAMSDALQPSGTIDSDLAVNLSDPPTGEQRPSDSLRYRTFYLHGIHFGLQHVY